MLMYAKKKKICARAKICRVCRDEKDVRIALDEVWDQPKSVGKILTQTLNRNQNVFAFEKVLSK